ncbi:MAG: hypothetical protein N2450_03105 [bacterium]|nr:hypothetical protein [bacterium]
MSSTTIYDCQDNTLTLEVLNSVRYELIKIQKEQYEKCLSDFFKTKIKIALKLAEPTNTLIQNPTVDVNAQIEELSQKNPALKKLIEMFKLKPLSE